jgi:transposase
MEAYPTKVRELVLDAYERGVGTGEIAETFQVSPSWARKVRRRWREHGVRTAIAQKHGPDPLLDAGRRGELAALVEATPGATLEELRRQLDVPVSVSTVFRALEDIRLTLKKSRRTPASRAGRT